MQQTNPYLKQFPELMKGKKILYVHGFGSSGQSGTVTRIREVFPNANVIAPDLPIHPEEAMALLRQLCQQEKPDLIIGTSMGGMYTEMLYGYDRILVNPALRMGDTMKEHGMIGAQHFSNPRQDGVQDFIVTKAMVKDYKEMTEHCFEGINEEEQHRVWGLFGDEDTTVNTYDLFHEHYPTAIRFHGEHRMNDHSFMHGVQHRRRCVLSLRPINSTSSLLHQQKRNTIVTSTNGSSSILPFLPGGIPSSPARKNCSMATISLTPRKQGPWAPSFSSVATPLRHGMTLPPILTV